MIRINLLGEKVDHSVAYAVHGLSLAAAVVVAAIGCFLLNDSVSSERELLTNDKTRLTAQLTRLTEKTKQVENLNASKKLLKEKLTTIAKLKAKKSGAVHLLSDISLATPERSWLTSIKSKSDGMEFNGVALDPQTVSSFMTKLTTSDWIAEVELKESKQTRRDDVPVQNFTLFVKDRNPLDVKKSESSGRGAAKVESNSEKGEK